MATGRKGAVTKSSTADGMDDAEREKALAQEQYIDPSILSGTTEQLKAAPDAWMTRQELAELLGEDRADSRRMVRRSLKLLEAKGMLESDRSEKQYRYRWLGVTQ